MIISKKLLEKYPDEKEGIIDKKFANLVKKIKKKIKNLKIKIIKNREDPDKRDYYVSNRKIEKKGFKANYSLDQGIKEILNIIKI